MAINFQSGEHLDITSIPDTAAFPVTNPVGSRKLKLGERFGAAIAS
jgi:hypothetical protein